MFYLLSNFYFFRCPWPNFVCKGHHTSSVVLVLLDVAQFPNDCWCYTSPIYLHLSLLRSSLFNFISSFHSFSTVTVFIFCTYICKPNFLQQSLTLWFPVDHLTKCAKINLISKLKVVNHLSWFIYHHSNLWCI